MELLQEIAAGLERSEISREQVFKLLDMQQEAALKGAENEFRGAFRREDVENQEAPTGQAVPKYHMRSSAHEEIDNWFTYHAPTNDSLREFYENIRNGGANLAHFIVLNVPSSRERSTALSRLREVVMWTDAAIACNPREDTDNG